MEIIKKYYIDDKIKVQLSDNFLKEDLERYYIDEKKSILEISRIYGCGSPTIKRKLEKYGISIRPHGAFLVCDDGETLNSKRNRGNISDGEYNNKSVKNKGYISVREYQDYLVENKGYKNWNDYVNIMNHKNGRHLSMSENKECSKYLGVHICENKEFLSKIINIIESMPCNNPGYDIVCTKGRKIDVKCACLKRNNTWEFGIKKNKVADYFLMISFDNRENLNVQHIWLVKCDAVIEKTTRNSKKFILNEKNTVTISNGKIGLNRWIKHEITDSYKLEEAQKLCDTFKNNNGDLNEL